MQEEQEKILINKRYINDLIYTLLNEGKLDKIVRHFKLIINSNCKDENNNLVLSQNIENFDEDDNAENVFNYTSIDNVNNIIDDTESIDFSDKHMYLNDIKEIIDSRRTTVLNDNINKLINSNFTDEEKNNIEEYLNNNNIYIRCGINPNNKEEYLIKLFELYISSYFNELSAKGQNKLLNESLLPMYNDTVFLANKKYDFLINKERIKNILDQFKENNNTND